MSKSFIADRDHESRGWAPSSMTPRGSGPLRMPSEFLGRLCLRGLLSIERDSGHKPGKNVGIPQVGDAGDLTAHSATIAIPIASSLGTIGVSKPGARSITLGPIGGVSTIEG
jgi:hypothetical protein